MSRRQRFALLSICLQLAFSAEALADAQKTGERPHKHGEPVPPGYHLEERQRIGFVYAGMGVGIPAYALSLVGLCCDRGGLFLIPVAGPWIWLAGHETPRTGGHEPDLADLAPIWVAVDGALQGVGLLFVTIGLSTTKTWRIRNSGSARPSFAVVPRARWDGAGLAIVGSF